MKRLAAIRIFACLATACLIEGWLVSSSVLASCGDYVMIGGHAAHAGPMSHDMPVGMHYDYATGHSDQPPPCHGPHCSRRSAPLPEQPASTSASQHDWGITMDDVPRLSVEPVGVVIYDRQPRAFLLAEPIFRPPRHA